MYVSHHTLPTKRTRVISRSEWNAMKRHGYTSKGQAGQLYVLSLDPASGATVLEPVSLGRGPYVEEQEARL